MSTAMNRFEGLQQLAAKFDRPEDYFDQLFTEPFTEWIAGRIKANMKPDILALLSATIDDYEDAETEAQKATQVIADIKEANSRLMGDVKRLDRKVDEVTSEREALAETNARLREALKEAEQKSTPAPNPEPERKTLIHTFEVSNGWRAMNAADKELAIHEADGWTIDHVNEHCWTDDSGDWTVQLITRTVMMKR